MTRHVTLCLLLAVLATLIQSETLGNLNEEELEVEDDGSFSDDNGLISAEDADDLAHEDLEDEEPSSSMLSVAISSDHMRGLHKKMDSDGNGGVSLMEILNFAQAMSRAIAMQDMKSVITSMDVDKDGKIGLPEFVQQGDPDSTEEDRQERTKDFYELDTNKDNKLDVDELPVYYHHYINPKVDGVLTVIAMKDKDLDNDGVLSLQEFFAHLQREDEPLRVPAQERQVFNELDKDRSGNLNVDELKAWESGSFSTEKAATDLFAGCDANGDGQLTANEMEQAREQIAANHSDPQMYLEEWRDVSFGDKRGEL